MKLLRIQMLRSRDQLVAGHFYNLPQDRAEQLIARGLAKIPGEWPQREIKPIGPSETKPAQPAELKERVKKNSKRGATAKES